MNVEAETGLITEPGYVQVDLLDGARMSGYQVSCSDPTTFAPDGVFCATDSEGTKSYILWKAIARVTIFPLSVTPPDQAPTEIGAPAPAEPAPAT